MLHTNSQCYNAAFQMAMHASVGTSEPCLRFDIASFFYWLCLGCSITSNVQGARRLQTPRAAAEAPSLPFRVGHGFDLHRLAEGYDLIIGGKKIEHTKGCEAHSDGDVLLHCVTDAILGARSETLRQQAMHGPIQSQLHVVYCPKRLDFRQGCALLVCRSD